MSESARRRGSLLSLFWTPLVAVGSSSPLRPNAQISVSTFGASIVPDQARLLSVIYKGNYTHELVEAKGSFSLTALAEDQVELLPALGSRSGRHEDKLTGLEYELTSRGNPVFGGLGWLDLDVIEAFDLGDATAFLGAVHDTRQLKDGRPLFWAEARQRLPADWLVSYEAEIARDADLSRSTMHWV